MLLPLLVILVLLNSSVRGESSTCPCSMCNVCLNGLLIKSPTEQNRMECYSLQKIIKDSSKSIEAESDKNPNDVSVGSFGLFRYWRFPRRTGIFKNRSNNNNRASIRPPPPNPPPQVAPQVKQAMPQLAFDSLTQNERDAINNSGGSDFYLVSTKATSTEIADMRCWRKLTGTRCDAEGKQPMLLAGTFICASMTTLVPHDTDWNLVYFQG